MSVSTEMFGTKIGAFRSTHVFSDARGLRLLFLMHTDVGYHLHIDCQPTRQALEEPPQSTAIPEWWTLGHPRRFLPCMRRWFDAVPRGFGSVSSDPEPWGKQTAICALKLVSIEAEMIVW